MFKKTCVVPAINNFCGIPVFKVLRVLPLKVELMSNFQGQLTGTENKQCLQFSYWHFGPDTVGSRALNRCYLSLVPTATSAIFIKSNMLSCFQ